MISGNGIDHYITKYGITHYGTPDYPAVETVRTPGSTLAPFATYPDYAKISGNGAEHYITEYGITPYGTLDESVDAPTNNSGASSSTAS